MFLRRYERRSGGRRRTYWALVESVRTGRGSRQRLVTYLAETDENDVTQMVYTAKPNQFGELVSQRRRADSKWDVDYFHFDALGSTANVSDNNEFVADDYLYDAFGNLLPGSSFVPAFLYVGQSGYYYDDELAQHDLRARFYDPATGRFVSEDPIGFAANDANLYRYVMNRPTNIIDPRGLQNPSPAATPPITGRRPPRPTNLIIKRPVLTGPSTHGRPGIRRALPMTTDSGHQRPSDDGLRRRGPTHWAALSGRQPAYLHVRRGRQPYGDGRSGRTTSTYDARNSVSSVTNPDAKMVAYAYDSLARRAGMTDPDDGRFTYTYDVAGRLVWVVNPQGEATTFGYDALGRMVQRELASGPRATHIYDDGGRNAVPIGRGISRQVAGCYVDASI